MKRPTGKHEPHDFPATVLNPGTADAQKVHRVACTSATCTAVATIPANATTGPYGMPKDAVVRKLTQSGWLVRRRGRTVICPACQGRGPDVGRLNPNPKPAKAVAVTITPKSGASEYEAVREAREAFACGDVPAVEVTYLDHPTTPAPVPITQEDEPMRGDFVSDDVKDQPAATSALKRAINAELHKVHEGDSGYSGDWSDAKLAQLLNCSPAAVAAIRGELFGPDTNEHARKAEAARTQELAAIRQLVTEGKGDVDSAMEALARADRKYADAMARLAKIEGRK